MRKFKKWIAIFLIVVLMVQYTSFVNLFSSISGQVFAEDTQNDIESPTTPQDVIITDLNESGITLNWSPSVDNIQTVGYSVYRNNIEIANVYETTFIDTSVNEAVYYSYQVAAYDSSNNYSELCEPITTILDFCRIRWKWSNFNL